VRYSCWLHPCFDNCQSTISAFDIQGAAKKKLQSTLKHCISYTFGVERKQICGNKDNQVK